jgi:hypothetical protein
MAEPTTLQLCESINIEAVTLYMMTEGGRLCGSVSKEDLRDEDEMRICSLTLEEEIRRADHGTYRNSTVIGAHQVLFPTRSFR